MALRVRVGAVRRLASCLLAPTFGRKEKQQQDRNGSGHTRHGRRSAAARGGPRATNCARGAHHTADKATSSHGGTTNNGGGYGP